MTSITPGPWRTDEDEHDAPHQDIYIIGADGHKIARVWQDDACHDRNAEQCANALAISMLPILLGMLKKAHWLMAESHHVLTTKNPHPDRYDGLDRDLASTCHGIQCVLEVIKSGEVK